MEKLKIDDHDGGEREPGDADVSGKGRGGEFIVKSV